MKKSIVSLLMTIVCAMCFIGCTTADKKIVTHEQDYSAFLNWNLESDGRKAIEKDIQFWENRLFDSPNDLVSQIKLAGLYSRRFGYSGNVADLISSDSFYNKANELQHHFSSGLYRSLAANAITQHRFLDAQQYLDSSIKMGDDRNVTWLQQFDVALELGNSLLAQQVLNDIDPNSFEYLIRSARFLDHYKGDLPAAIRTMEKALKKVRQVGNKSLIQWTLVNLGDMYGHNNQFEKAYESYLDVLRVDPNTYHALKGIAWLAYSHDGDTRRAKEILNFLKAKQPLPDYELMMAEIERQENGIKITNVYLNNFIAEATKPCYGDMYNKYLFNIYVDDLKDYKSAMAIASKEIHNRPTPESYDLLAFALLKSGRIDEAKVVADKYVKRKCYEPLSKYHLGLIAQATGDQKEAQVYFRGALVSAFELGPAITQEIRSLVN